MKNLIFYLICICQLSTAQVATEIEITSFASIEFPGATAVEETVDYTTYNYTDEDAYYITLVNATNDPILENLDRDQIYEFYDGVSQGIVKPENTELKSSTRIEINNYPVLDIEYTAQDAIEDSNQRFTRVILKGQTLVVINFFVKENTKDFEKLRDQYFNSLHLNISQEDLAKLEENALLNSDAYKSGERIGSLAGVVIVIFVIIGIIVGAVFLILFIIKRNKKPVEPRPITTSTKFKTESRKCQHCNKVNTTTMKYCTSCGYQL